MFPAPPSKGKRLPQEIALTAQVVMYTTAVCPYCVAAQNFLKSRGATWEEVRVDTDIEARRRMMELAKRSSVPQIFINGNHVGGYDDLVALDRRGGLAPLLEGQA
jgi:glutaredoxin 3